MILLLFMFLVLLEANMTLLVQIEVYQCTFSACHLAAEDLRVYTNLMPCNTQKVKRYSYWYLIDKRNENSVMP